MQKMLSSQKIKFCFDICSNLCPLLSDIRTQNMVRINNIIKLRQIQDILRQKNDTNDVDMLCCLPKLDLNKGHFTLVPACISSVNSVIV